MLFEEKKKGLKITPSSKHFSFMMESKKDNERLNEIDVIRTVYSNEIKYISKVKIIKIAIDNLINDLEEQASEEEAIEYIRTLYKKAEF